jgi:AcrR family transcriptional regulator
MRVEPVGTRPSPEPDAQPVLEPRPRNGRPRPGRERLLSTADELLYRDGLQSTGIDLIISQAGVAKGTLYGNFGTKDDLIDAYLEARHHRTIAVFEEIEASGGGPVHQVEAVFDYLAAQSQEESFRGCAFVLGAAEIPAEDRAPMRWARTHKRAVHELFLRMFRVGGVRESATVANQVCILYDGALVTSVVRPESNAIECAWQMALAVVSAAQGPA